MTGNFSFGPYFREQAILYAWEFLTRTIGIPADRLVVSVHRNDKESARLWRSIVGLPDSRILSHFGDEDNMWSMGHGPGPCGYCTEIFYDLQREVDGERCGCHTIVSVLLLTTHSLLFLSRQVIRDLESRFHGVLSATGWFFETAACAVC